MPDTANIVLHAWDGARHLLAPAVRWTAQTMDGRPLSAGRKTLLFNLRGGSQVLTVPFFDNLFDSYTVIANAKGYETSAWYPVDVTAYRPVTLDLMFLPRKGVPHFAGATWPRLLEARPGVAAIIERGCANAADAAVKYGVIQEERPEALACLLNVMTALADLRLPSGKSPLEYYWNINWPSGDANTPEWLNALDAVSRPDRFFCYVDQNMLADVREGVGHGFSRELNPEAWGHAGATESYKQTQFDMANLQLTFHGRNTATFPGPNGEPVSCVKIEPDIDYYRDVAAHGLLEVLPNLLTNGRTDPKVTYCLRWMATKREGLPDFDPLYTVEPPDGSTA